MIIDYDLIISIFEADIKKYYTCYYDLKSVMGCDWCKRNYIAKDMTSACNGDFVIETAYESENVIELMGDSVECIPETILLCDENNPTYILADAWCIGKVQKMYRTELVDGTGYEHCGVFGELKGDVTEIINSDVNVRYMTTEDRSLFIGLAPSDWANFPIILKCLKNSTKILISEYRGKPSGYLAYGSSYEKYEDIANVFVHRDFRKHGVAKALMSRFIKDVVNNGKEGAGNKRA